MLTAAAAQVIAGGRRPRAAAEWTDPAQSSWLAELRASRPLTVAVVGGSGRLGSWLARFLTTAGHQVVVLDSVPPQPTPGLRYVGCSVGWHGTVPPGTLRGVDAVVHLAALHGPHLVAGVDRRRFWQVNVEGTARLLEAAVDHGVRRFVLASSTSIFGSGSPSGEPARVLEETTPVAPEDVYDLTKLAAERLLAGATGGAMTGVALRFGRFFFGSQADYHLRKLSTGLDVRDACQVIVRAVLAPSLRRPAYCVASDVPLTVEQRARMGLDLPAVVAAALPGFAEAALARGMPLPARVGKSVSTALARAELGYAPERGLDWLLDTWTAEDQQRGSAGSPRAHRPELVDLT